MDVILAGSLGQNGVVALELERLPHPSVARQIGLLVLVHLVVGRGGGRPLGLLLLLRLVRLDGVQLLLELGEQLQRHVLPLRPLLRHGGLLGGVLALGGNSTVIKILSKQINQT